MVGSGIKLFLKRELVQPYGSAFDLDRRRRTLWNMLASGLVPGDHGAVMSASWGNEAEPLETPVLLVDLDRLERNLDRIADYTRQHGLSLRPHIKTHKSPWVAAQQIRRGAAGLTCATLLEAEVMAGVCDDILLAYPPVGNTKLQRLLSLPDHVQLTVALDSTEVAERLARAAAVRGREVGVYVELDLGMHRVGLAAIEDAVALARYVSSRAPLVYRGITFYPGHIRAPLVEQDQEIHRLATDVRNALAAFDRAGLPPEVVSGGSTPTITRAHEIVGLTEVRPGTYVYNDRITQQ